MLLTTCVNLKGKDNYKGINISNDHTITERNMIREKVDEAKKENENEQNLYTCVVRGTPNSKNGLCIKRVKKTSNKDLKTGRV